MVSTHPNSSNGIISPSRGENQTCLSCHHLEYESIESFFKISPNPSKQFHPTNSTTHFLFVMPPLFSTPWDFPWDFFSPTNDLLGLDWGDVWAWFFRWVFQGQPGYGWLNSMIFVSTMDDSILFWMIKWLNVFFNECSLFQLYVFSLCYFNACRLLSPHCFFGKHPIHPAVMHTKIPLDQFGMSCVSGIFQSIKVYRSKFRCAYQYFGRLRGCHMLIDIMMTWNQ